MALRKLGGITCLLLLLTVTVSAQDTENPDELFKQARIAAFEHENYTEAIQLAQQALEIAPEYTGIRIFLARVYFWNGQHEQARKIFYDLLHKHPKNQQVRTELITLELDSDRARRALFLAEEGLMINPDSLNPDYLFLKGRALNNLGQKEEALEVFRRVRQKDPGRRHIDAMIRNLQEQMLHWRSMVSYSYEYLSEPFDPWQMGTFELLRKTGAGDIVGRVNMGERFARTDYQVELDVYPTFSDNFYAYLNIGYSGSTFFPQYRAGASLYLALPKSLEVELGFRYLDFKDPRVMIYTASLSKYIGKLLFTVRPFFTPDLEGGNSFSTLLILRRYFATADDYIGLVAGTGSSPTGFNSQQDIQRLGSNRIELELQKKLSARFHIKGTIGYMREEYRPDTSRERIIGGLHLYFHF